MCTRAVIRASLPGAARVSASDAGVSSVAITCEASVVWVGDAAVCCGSLIRAKLASSCVQRVVAAPARGACLVTTVVNPDDDSGRDWGIGGVPFIAFIARGRWSSVPKYTTLSSLLGAGEDVT